MEFVMRIIDQGQERTKVVEKGENLLSVLQDSDTTIHAPCGGKGTCNKCKVEIQGFGEVLTCQTLLDESLCNKVNGEIVVILPRQGKAKIQSGGTLPEFTLSPLLEKIDLDFPRPEITDQKPDDERVSNVSKHRIPFHLLPFLPDSLRKNHFQLKYLVRKDLNEMAILESDGNLMDFHGVAIDIGTTTVAAYLYDLSTGRLIGTKSCLNPQKGYGADVISRIDYASQSVENLKQLQHAIGDVIIDLLFDLSKSIQNISLISIAGNTTMLHLLWGINPAAIASAPFIPVTLHSRIQYAKEMFPFFPDNLTYNPVCMVLPSISAYVGADVVAGILTCKMDTDPRPQLLVDIGTNGEIALSKNGQIVACSTAAGPAFEGANITCGMGGVTGAIDRVMYTDGEIQFTTISGELATGICGSGIVSAVASLLNAGVIDETGRFEDDEEKVSELLQTRVMEYENEICFVFSKDESGKPMVYLTQRDIREVQNAKAAVCAGIQLLMENQNIKAMDIENVYIAGGFGNYLNIDDAFRIGLLPSELNGKAKMMGNTSGLGASLCLLDSRLLARSEAICSRTTYYELSSDKRFTDLYIEAMMFE